MYEFKVGDEVLVTASENQLESVYANPLMSGMSATITAIQDDEHGCTIKLFVADNISRTWVTPEHIILKTEK
jgi:hypothetical protein